MPFLGTIVNFFVVLITGTLGALIKKSIPKRISDGIMSAVAICVVYIGIEGALEPAPAVGEDSLFSAGLVKLLVMIISIGVGTLLGELIDIDKWVGRLGDFVESKLARGGEKGNFARGFVGCGILFCVGAMAVNGAIQDMAGELDLLLAKSVIDGITCFLMASSLGIGCAFSAFLLLAYQGLLSVIGFLIVEYLPASSLTYMSVTGSLVVILIGTNVLGITKIKTANMIPAVFLPALVAPLLGLVV